MPIALPAWYSGADRPGKIERIGPDGVVHRITVIVPTRNEAANVGPVLELVAPHADELLVSRRP